MSAADEKNACCPAGSLPGLVPDEQRALNGKVEKLTGDLSLYVVDKGSKSAILVVYDIFGFSGGRMKGVVDALAEKTGFTAAMPDFYRGTNITKEGGFGSETGMKFLKSITWEKVSADLELVYAALSKRGVEKMGIVGLCWGAYVVFKASASGRVTCGASAHPSLRVGNWFDDPEDAQAKAVKVPQLILPTNNDPDNVKPGGSVENILKANNVPVQMHVFDDMKHGFLSRGDTKDSKVERDVKLALSKMTEFFKANL